MPHRLILYDALEALNQGQILVKAGDLSLGMRLNHVPEISIVFTLMINNGYLLQLPPVEPANEDLRHFTISAKGRAALADGRRWYRSLPWPLRIWGRLGLPLPR